MTVTAADNVEISLLGNSLLECLNHRIFGKEVRTIKVVYPALYSKIVETEFRSETGEKTSH